jgi:hypothetical protein
MEDFGYETQLLACFFPDHLLVRVWGAVRCFVGCRSRKFPKTNPEPIGPVI